MTDTVRTSLVESYTPKLISVLGERYGLRDLKADALAGLTVAIVALPLSMAIAVASGASPERGLYAAIVGGFLVSALGGSRFQIGGPAGAFIVLVAVTVQAHGIEGAILATLLSGAFLLVLGALRLGGLIRLVPKPVTVGFTAGIAVVIVASQIKDFLGLRLAGAEPGPLFEKLPALAAALPSAQAASIGVGGFTVLVILALKRWAPRWPGMLVAVGGAALSAALLQLPVDTIASRFGAIPHGLPTPHWPDMTSAKVMAVLPAALAFTLLGGIESLLSAVVADQMTGRRHRSNLELMAQGAANIGSALFGGISVTGTIARTATNVRAGAKGPLAGMFHSVFLLLFILVAAPLAGYIPLAALAGVLVVVAWNMVEREQVVRKLRSREAAVVLLATLVLTLAHDLIAGIATGCVLYAGIALWKRSRGAPEA